MQNINILLKFFEKGFVIKFLLLALLYTVLPLTEIFLLIFIGGKFGNYLMLGLAASTGLFGVLIACLESKKAVYRLKEKVKTGEYPKQEFKALAGVFLGGILLISPGFITDLCGLLMFVPLIRNAATAPLIKKMDKKLKEIYEYLKLYEV